MAEQPEKNGKSQTRAVQGFDCDTLLKEMGTRIRLRRQQLDMSQPELAKKLSIAANSVSQYEAGLADFSVCRLAQIADALLTTTEYLLHGIDNSPAAAANQALKRTMMETMREFELERLEMVDRLRRSGPPDLDGVADALLASGDLPALLRDPAK